MFRILRRFLSRNITTVSRTGWEARRQRRVENASDTLLRGRCRRSHMVHARFWQFSKHAVHWEHFDKHERERRKQLVAEWKRREEEKLDAGTSSGSSDPEKHWDNWKHFEVRQVRTQRVARVSKHDK